MGLEGQNSSGVESVKLFIGVFWGFLEYAQERPKLLVSEVLMPGR